MRTLWNAISFLAVVNMLALVLVIGWLGYSDRLDRSRIEAVRDLFMPTITSMEEASEEPTEPSGDGVTEISEVDSPGLPVTHLGPITLSELRDDLEMETRIALERQAETIRANIDHHYEERRSEIETRERTVIAREKRFEEMRARSADEEFKQTIADLEEMKVDAAFAIVQSWWREAEEPRTAVPGRRTFVVDVLAALDSERRTKLLTEFVETGQPKVAADLQLALRDRASVTTPGMELPDADPASSQYSPSPVAVGGDSNL